MYYPYLRGRQFELIAVRENATRMADLIVPIIEPVKSSTRSLRRAVEALIEAEQRFIIVANPTVGEFKEDPRSLTAELTENYLTAYDNWSVGWVVQESTTEDEIQSAFDLREKVAIIHGGFPRGGELAEMFARSPGATHHVFLEETSKLYRRHFMDGVRILIRDGFDAKPRNIDYPDVEHFSDLHVTFGDEGMHGFGDYLIVGDGFSEGGGPAYAIAVHLTYVDADEDNDMFVAHYKSDRYVSPADPGGKFAEALAKLVVHVTREDTPVLQTDAVREFIQLHESGHYPGLGYAKKISMQHHIELMIAFLARTA